MVPKQPGQKLGPLFEKFGADIVCFQESKVDGKGSLTEDLIHVEGYESFWSFCSVRKGYSGTRKGRVVDASVAPFGIPEFDNEGRVVMTDHGSFVLFNVYFPNSGKGDDRLEYKLRFQNKLIEIWDNLIKSGRQVIIVGDFNVVHQDMDIFKVKPEIAGCLPEERSWFDAFLKRGYIDSFRYKYPTVVKYSWFDVKTSQRQLNQGWRIDYCVVDEANKHRILDADILVNQIGSDHVPVTLSYDAEMATRESAVSPHPLSSDFNRKKQVNLMSFFGGSKPKAAGESEGGGGEGMKRALEGESDGEPAAKKARVEEPS